MYNAVNKVVASKRIVLLGGLLLLILLIPFQGSSQCFACDEYKEALKKPSDVRMLQLKQTAEQPDDRLAACENLQVLFWESSNLSHLPDSFGQLRNLTDLSLANNAFSEFPEVILRLKSLKVLNLQGNKFDEQTKVRIRTAVEKELPNTRLFL